MVSRQIMIDKRQTPRVPIVGKVEFALPSQTISFRITTIGKGGFGLIYEGQDLSLLNNCKKALLFSKNLESPVEIEGEYLYRNEDGYIGFRFTTLNEPTVQSITSYVDQFLVA